ncbi:MAG: helix-hairpin-helix domain-containing protein [Acidobacteria bacterium]|nr:helix-hairpin-helix domain-containing protein [Acidobacteriota bacterium]
MASRTVRRLGLVIALAIALTIWAPHITADTASKPDTPKINLNTAPASELARLPRIGDKIAQRIVEFRTKNGQFKAPEDLMKVSGVGEKIFAEIKGQVTVGASAPQTK